MKKNYVVLDRRDFLKKSALGLASLSLAPALLAKSAKAGKLRTAHIGLGGMGMEDLRAISSHPMVEVVALCDVDSNALTNATALFPQAKTFSDYRILLKDMKNQIDAVVVSTPDHTHAPGKRIGNPNGYTSAFFLRLQTGYPSHSIWDHWKGPYGTSLVTQKLGI